MSGQRGIGGSWNWGLGKTVTYFENGVLSWAVDDGEWIEGEGGDGSNGKATGGVGVFLSWFFGRGECGVWWRVNAGDVGGVKRGSGDGEEEERCL